MESFLMSFSTEAFVAQEAQGPTECQEEWPLPAATMPLEEISTGMI